MSGEARPRRLDLTRSSSSRSSSALWLGLWSGSAQPWPRRAASACARHRNAGVTSPSHMKRREQPPREFLQANPNKSKQNRLNLLGFIRPNRDFSTDYRRKNKKLRLASQVLCKTSQTHPDCLFRGLHRLVASRSGDWKESSPYFCFLQAFAVDSARYWRHSLSTGIATTTARLIRVPIWTIRSPHLLWEGVGRPSLFPFGPNSAKRGGRPSRPGPAPVAQLDRALPSEGRGHRFESCRARQ